jgi:hypothetical protein
MQAVRLRKYEQECENEERHARELDFYRNIARSNYTSEVLEYLMASHNLSDASQLQQALSKLRPKPRGNFPNPNPNPNPQARATPPAPLNDQPVNRPDTTTRTDRPPRRPSGNSSINPYINGQKTWESSMGLLCVVCGELGHVPKECPNPPLTYWEQSALKRIVFGNSSYEPPCRDPPPASLIEAVTSLASVSPPNNPTLPSCNSLVLSFSIPVSSGLTADDTMTKQIEPEVFLGENSGPNKRFLPEDTVGRPDFTQRDIPPDAPYDPASAPFTMLEDRPKAKPRRRTRQRKNKGSRLVPIRGLFDENSGQWEKPTSIREPLKKMRVELSFLELCSMSPTVSQETKRLITRNTKPKSPRAVPSTQAPPPTQTSNPGNTSGIPNPFEFIPTTIRPNAQSVTTSENNVNTRHLQ